MLFDTVEIGNTLSSWPNVLQAVIFGFKKIGFIRLHSFDVNLINILHKAPIQKPPSLTNIVIMIAIVR